MDVFDALISKRAYKKAFTYSETRTILQQGDARLHPEESFDPNLLKLFLDHYDQFVAIHQQSLERKQQFQDQRLNVLVLEDDDLLLSTINEHFHETLDYADFLGFETITGMNRFLDENPAYYPQLCFIDVNLPDGSGHDAAEGLKERFPESHLICITADEDIDVNRVNLYGHRVFRKVPGQMDEFMGNLVKTAAIIKEYHANPYKI